MTSPVERALEYVRRRCDAGSGEVNFPVTLNFHPDIAVAGGIAIELIARSGTYRSQFETGMSSGGLTAHRGGDRWHWESRIFGGAYDEDDPALRPKYGALNHRLDPVGGSRRFGSCHFRLSPRVLPRTTFCYPDSHLEPHDFAVGDAAALIALAEVNELGLDQLLDNYVEAHVHGPLRVGEDIEALVLDPSYRGTSVENAANALGCPVEWHEGFHLDLNHAPDFELFRGAVAAEAIARIAENGMVTPAILGCARDRALDYQTAKWVWHCIARFGHP